MSKTIETDVRTFVKFWLVPVGIMAVIFFLYKALTGLVIIGISIFLALALKPLVRKVNLFFNKHFGDDKKHQTTSAILAYLIVVLVIGGIILTIGPVVINETSKFIQQFPQTFQTNFGGWDGINNFGRTFGIDNLQGEIANALSNLSHTLVGNLGADFIASVSGVADIIMKIVLVLVLTFLFLLEGPSMSNALWNRLSAGDDDKKSITVAKRITAKMANVISTYVSRQMIVAVFDGLASGLIVLLLSLIFNFSPAIAIPMGMTTMIFYMIPMFGQFIAGVLVTLILVVSSPIAAIIFAVVYIIYAQIENNVIAPKIQGNALNLPAVMILCAIVIGMYMFGIIGAIIAIPIAGCIRVLIDEYPNIIKAAKR